MCQLVVLVLLTQTQDALIPVIATVVTQETMAADDGEEGLPHGYPWISLHCQTPFCLGTISLKLVETSQVSEKRISISLHAGTPPRNIKFRVQGKEARVQGLATISFH